MNTSNQIATAEKLLQVGAVKLNVEHPFTWTSGWKSPIYCDNRKILSYPNVRDFIKSEMSNVIFEHYPDAELIAGVSTAGIAWGALVADQLKLPMIYVRGKAKEHGLSKQIEGQFEEGKKTIVVEDLISTGKSSMEVVSVLRKEGLIVDSVVSIFNYDYQEPADIFAKEAIENRSLTSYNVLIDIAMQRGIVPVSAKESLEKWRESPASWGR